MKRRIGMFLALFLSLFAVVSCTDKQEEVIEDNKEENTNVEDNNKDNKEDNNNKEDDNKEDEIVYLLDQEILDQVKPIYEKAKAKKYDAYSITMEELGSTEHYMESYKYKEGYYSFESDINGIIGKKYYFKTDKCYSVEYSSGSSYDTTLSKATYTAMTESDYNTGMNYLKSFASDVIPGLSSYIYATKSNYSPSYEVQKFDVDGDSLELDVNCIYDNSVDSTTIKSFCFKFEDGALSTFTVKTDALMV